MGERVLCKHEVVGSIPSASTKIDKLRMMYTFALLYSVSEDRNDLRRGRLAARVNTRRGSVDDAGDLSPYIKNILT